MKVNLDGLAGKWITHRSGRLLYDCAEIVGAIVLDSRPRIEVIIQLGCAREGDRGDLIEWPWTVDASTFHDTAVEAFVALFEHIPDDA